MNLVLDTCALLWFTLDPSELSGAAHKKISKAETLLVSSISIWEIGIKNLRGRLDLGMKFDEYVGRLEQTAELEIVSIDSRQWVESLLLDWAHRDPADRIIVALAKQHKATLVTDDQTIAKFYSSTIS